MKVWIGKTLIFIAIAHSIIGCILYRSALNLLIKDRVFNTIALTGNPNRSSAFWFLYSGFLLLLIGYFVDYLEQLELDIPLPCVAILSSLVAMGVIVMPVSGFWLLIAPMVGLIVRKINFKGRSSSQ
ncbi:DUF6463 family protein [Leptothoe kymatousa]|uniref:Uncharacterized protein n=1 Tax=Leptothoe kymatousa TAU-MAC 1615 TaxID=2364775 RepID=A0ABS5Y3W7_9CYAN|nr:DUF6463 family protein [Leptothoe kymatousa]MBT9312059.1 hypothetical protein [Leptothoe kymatousa TAU-MAC 1615]